MKNAEYRGKKLLILGGSAVNCKFVEAARKLEIYTIVADVKSNAPAKSIADEALDCSVFDAEKIIDYCRRNSVDGVANFSNTFSQLTCRRIVDELGLPGYGSEADISALTEKNAFKAACLRYGVDVIPSYAEEDIAAERVEYPIVIKPDDNSGSRGISFCRNRTEADAALQEARRQSTNGRLVIEKSMRGKPDFTVTYYCINGEPYLNRIGDRVLGADAEGLSCSCICTAAPSRYTDFFVEKIDARLRAMLKGLHFENGPIFMQGFVDGETIRFYDPGARFPGGGEYETSLTRATGVDFVKLAVLYAVTGRTEIEAERLHNVYFLNGKKYIQLSFALNAGVIGSVAGLEEIRALPAVCSVTQKAFPGDIIDASLFSARRLCEICLLVDNESETIRRSIEQVRSRLSCCDIEGRDQLASAVTAEQIL